jgi:hypothetical protein
MSARFVLDAVSKIMQEGNWSLPHRPFCGVGTPGYDRLRVRPTFASFAELSESARDRDTQARREETIFLLHFLHLLHFLPFATLSSLQQKPQVNFTLACWLQNWEILFWQWQSATASKHGLCRVPTLLDYAGESRARNAPCISRCEPLWRHPHGREHPFITCPTSTKNARNDDDVFYLFLQKQKSAQSYIPQGYFLPYEPV